MKRQKTRKIILLISTLLFPITLNYLSPYLIIRGGFEGVLSGSAVLFAGMLLTSIIFGRAFCSWICPAGGLQDICSDIVKKSPGKRQKYIKYFIWVPWLASIALGFISAGGLKQIDIFYCTDYGISVSAPTGYIMYFFVVTSIVVLSLTLGKRSFCHSVCWMAPFMVLGSLMKEKLHIPSLRIKSIPDKCAGCGACTRACPMSLPVGDMAAKNKMFDTECILCGNCADVCPKKAIAMGFFTFPGKSYVTDNSSAHSGSSLKEIQ